MPHSGCSALHWLNPNFSKSAISSLWVKVVIHKYSYINIYIYIYISNVFNIFNIYIKYTYIKYVYIHIHIYMGYIYIYIYMWVCGWVHNGVFLDRHSIWLSDPAPIIKVTPGMTLFRVTIFSLLKICHTYFTIMKLGTVIPYLKITSYEAL